MYTEDTVKLEKVVQHIFELFKFELSNCKYIKLELRANVGVYKHKLDDIQDEVWHKLNSAAITNSTFEKFYADDNISDEECNYRIWIYQ